MPLFFFLKLVLLFKPCSITSESAWEDAGNDAVCDVSAGEKYLSNSPGAGQTIETCRRTCEDSAECQSITFYNSGWCSHWSTLCAVTKRNDKAKSLRFVLAPTQTATEPTTTATTTESTSTITGGWFFLNMLLLCCMSIFDEARVYMRGYHDRAH